jgi:hypothetical protein
VFRTYLKKKIFVPDQGEAKHQPAGILEYFEDLMRGFNADMGQKDFFEIGSNKNARSLRPTAKRRTGCHCYKACDRVRRFD